MLQPGHQVGIADASMPHHIYGSVHVSDKGTAFLGDNVTTYNMMGYSYLRVVVRHRLDNSFTVRSRNSWGLPWLLKATKDIVRRTKKDGHEVSSFWRFSVLGKYMLSFGMTVESSGDLHLFRPRLQHIIPEDSKVVASIICGDLGSVRKLFLTGQAGVNDVTSNNRTLLYHAIKNEQIVMLEELLRLGADCNQVFGADGTSHLAWALYKRNPRMVRALLKHGADTQFMSRCRGWSVMFYLWIDENVTQPSCTDFLNILRTQDSDLLKLAEYTLIDEDGWSLLSRAASSGTRCEIEYLTRCGADIYWKDVYDWNAIFEAVHGRKLEIVKYFAECDPSLLYVRDVRGWTLLHIAASCSHETIIRYLLKQGLDPEARSWACEAGVSENLRGRECTPADVAFAKDIEHGERFYEILEQVISPDYADTEI